MTDERNRIDPGAKAEAIVTEAYRDTTDERAPDALNRAILDQAARAARPRYSRIRLWTRPMAWAATVMLSVAIVMQLTQTPVPDEIGFDESTYEIVAPTGLSEARQRERQSKASAVEQGVVEQEPAARAPASPSASADKVRLETDNNAYEFKDEDMLKRADDMARMREGDIEEAVVADDLSQTFAADAESVGVASTYSAPERCDETATATPETWLQCITALEEAGLTDAADAERKLLAAAFPDFHTP